MEDIQKLIQQQLAPFLAEVTELKQRVSLVEQLQQENADLKLQLQKALLENEQLKKNQKTNMPTNNSAVNSNNNTQVLQQSTASSSTTADSRWANAAKKNLNTPKKAQNTQKAQKQLKTQKPTKKDPPTEGMLNWAYRGFTENTGPTGYQFIHFRNPARTNQRTVRKRLAIIGISNRRVLAVQFPTKGVISLLVHNAYADEIKASLAKGKVTPMNFDPHHESVICDPKHANLSVQQKQTMATDIYYSRMHKLCLAMQPAHVGSSIIRHFNQLVNSQFHLPDAIVTNFFKARAEPSQSDNSSAQQQQATEQSQKETDLDEDLHAEGFMSDEDLETLQ